MIDAPILSFYKYALNQSGELDYIGSVGAYTSLRWSNRVRGAGDIEIHIPVEYVKSFLDDLQLDCFIKIDRSLKEEYGVIQYMKFTVNNYGKEELTIIGKTVSWLWSWRVPSLNSESGYTAGAINYGSAKGFTQLRRILASSLSYGGLSYLDDELRFFNGINYIDSTTDTTQKQFQTSMNDTHSVVEALCESFECGYHTKIIQDANDSNKTKLQVTVYNPTLNTSAVFDYARGNISNFEYTVSDDSEKDAYYYIRKNVSDVIQGGQIVKTVTYDNHLVGVYNNDKPKIVWIGIDEDEQNMISSGARKIKELLPVETVDGTAEVRFFDYLVDFNLGDIVSVGNSDWGITMNKTIMEVSEVWEDKYTCNVTFGEPQDIVYKKLKKIIER